MTKSFKNGLHTLLNETADKMDDETGKKRIYPKTQNHPSRKGTRAGDIRATFIMNEAQLEHIKAMAYWERISIKTVIFEAIGDYLNKKKPELTNALNAYQKKLTVDNK